MMALAGFLYEFELPFRLQARPRGGRSVQARGDRLA